MVGVYKMHLCQYLLNLIQLSSETVKNISPKHVKKLGFIVYKYKYRTEELMIMADTAMPDASNKRSEQNHQFFIPRPPSNVWGKGWELEKERIIEMFKPVMNKKRDQECMELYLNKVRVDGVQDPGLTPFKEFLLRPAPLVDYLSVLYQSV